jgi:hypothetical protein
MIILILALIVVVTVIIMSVKKLKNKPVSSPGPILKQLQKATDDCYQNVLKIYRSLSGLSFLDDLVADENRLYIGYSESVAGSLITSFELNLINFKKLINVDGTENSMEELTQNFMHMNDQRLVIDGHLQVISGYLHFYYKVTTGITDKSYAHLFQLMNVSDTFSIIAEKFQALTLLYNTHIYGTFNIDKQFMIGVRNNGQLLFFYYLKLRADVLGSNYYSPNLGPKIIDFNKKIHLILIDYIVIYEKYMFPNYDTNNMYNNISKILPMLDKNKKDFDSKVKPLALEIINDPLVVSEKILSSVILDQINSTFTILINDVN